MFFQRGGCLHVVNFKNFVLCVVEGVRVFETHLTVSNRHYVNSLQKPLDSL